MIMFELFLFFIFIMFVYNYHLISYEFTKFTSSVLGKLLSIVIIIMITLSRGYVSGIILSLLFILILEHSYSKQEGFENKSSKNQEQTETETDEHTRVNITDEDEDLKRPKSSNKDTVVPNIEYHEEQDDDKPKSQEPKHIEQFSLYNI